MHCEHEHHEQNHEKSGAREDAWQDANHHSRPSQVKSNAAMPPALENDPEDLVVKEEACGAFHGAEAAAEPASAAAEEVAHGGGDEGQARASGEGDRLLLATGRSESAGPAEGANHAECQGQGGVFHEDRKRLQLLQALAHSDRQLFLREQEDTTEHARAHAHTHTPSEREGVSKRATRAGGGTERRGRSVLAAGWTRGSVDVWRWRAEVRPSTAVRAPPARKPQRLRRYRTHARRAMRLPWQSMMQLRARQDQPP